MTFFDIISIISDFANIVCVYIAIVKIVIQVNKK